MFVVCAFQYHFTIGSGEENSLRQLLGEGNQLGKFLYAFQLET